MIPQSLQWLAERPDGAAWLDRLPGLLEAVCIDWDLQPDGAETAGCVSYVLPVRRGSQRFALKIQWPHDECLYEAEALRRWDGDGAVRLIAHDAQRHVLLLEWCAPGGKLAEAAEADPIGIVAGLLRRLCKPADAPFRSLADEATAWAAGLHENWLAAGRPCERRLVDAAHGYLIDLKDTQGEPVLLHQDLHGDNILAAEREPWLAIDPKPLTGDVAFAAAPVVRSFEFGDSRKDTLDRFDRITEALDLDRARARGWTIGQTMAWAFDSTWAEKHFLTARWLLEER